MGVWKPGQLNFHTKEERREAGVDLPGFEDDPDWGEDLFMPILKEFTVTTSP